MKINKIIIACCFLLAVYSCSNNPTKDADNSAESCTNPNSNDPNGVKPMALMMRTMVGYCDSMRFKINKNIVVDSTQYPLMPFWSAEPTDSSVLGDVYTNHANNFKIAYRNLMSDTIHQKENYTLVIQECTNCHNSFCSGPLKRIKKLSLDYKE